MNKSRIESVSAVRAMLAIVTITFTVELAIMGVLAALGLVGSPTLTVPLDALLLSLVTAPPIYWLVLIPIRREYEKRLEAEVLAADMSQLAITDALTRIMNRRGITVALLESMAQAERYNTPLTVAMADIDFFKKVNDEYGHKAGDTVLIGVAGALNDALRMPDKVGRYGGEEFLVVLPHTSLVQGRKIAERIRAAVGKRTFEYDDSTIGVTISMGVTQFHKGEDLQQLLSRVDAAMYDAKAGGRNCVVARKA